MGYRIRPEADFTDEFRSAAEEQLTRAITVLQEQPEGAHEAIHAFRKNIKRLRSLYRLVSCDVPEFQKRENARLRETARSLSTIRDAAAIVDTARYLQDNARNLEEAEALDRIVSILEARRDWMAEAESGLDQRLHDAADALREAIAALDDITFDKSHRKNARMLAKSWRRTASRARKALDACHEDATADDFHELRKRTYDYRLYHALLRDLWPSAMKAKRDFAKDLVERLDTSTISPYFRVSLRQSRSSSPATTISPICWMPSSFVSRRIGETLLSAETLYGDDPDDEAQRLEILWVSIRN